VPLPMWEFAPKLHALALPEPGPQFDSVHVVNAPVPVTEALPRFVDPPEMENDRSDRRSARLPGAEVAVSIRLIVTVPLPRPDPTGRLAPQRRTLPRHASL
jgi:hypothetical protein